MISNFYKKLINGEGVVVPCVDFGDSIGVYSSPVLAMVASWARQNGKTVVYDFDTNMARLVKDVD